MSHKKKVLNHLKRGRTLSGLQALKLYGCYRLAARIADLRKEGHTIKTDTRNGYAVYSMEKLKESK